MRKHYPFLIEAENWQVFKDDCSEHNEQYYMFNKTIQDIFIYLTFVICWYIIAYYITSKLLKKDYGKRSSYSTFSSRLLVWATAISFTVSFASIFQLPITILAHELLLEIPNDVRCKFFHWLDSTLIIGYWYYVFIGGNIVLLVLMPFSYFFYEFETEKGKSQYKSWSEYSQWYHQFNGWKFFFYKILKTFLIVLIVWVLVVSATVLIASMIGQLPANRFDILEYLRFLHSILAFIGACTFLRCVPIGILQMISFSWHLANVPFFREALEQKRESVYMENLTLETSVKAQKLETKKYKLQKDLQIVKARLGELDKQLAQSNLYLYTLRFLSICWCGITVLAAIFLIFRLLKNLLGLMMLFFKSWGLFYIGRRRNDKFIILEKKSFGKMNVFSLGSVEAFVEILMILFYFASGIFGFYFSAHTNKFSVKWGAMSKHQLFINAAIFLTLSRDLQILVFAIGVTRMDPMGYSNSFKWLDNDGLVLIYNFMFFVNFIYLIYLKINGAQILYRAKKWWYGEDETPVQIYADLANEKID